MFVLYELQCDCDDNKHNVKLIASSEYKYKLKNLKESICSATTHWVKQEKKWHKHCKETITNFFAQHKHAINYDFVFARWPACRQGHIRKGENEYDFIPFLIDNEYQAIAAGKSEDFTFSKYFYIEKLTEQIPTFPLYPKRPKLHHRLCDYFIKEVEEI